jgi:hypothetical protein
LRREALRRDCLLHAKWRRRGRPGAVASLSAVPAVSTVSAIPTVPAVSTLSAELRTAVRTALRARSARCPAGQQQLFELLPQFEQPIQSTFEQFVVAAIEQLGAVVELEQRAIELEQQFAKLEQSVELQQFQRSVELQQFQQSVELQQFQRSVELQQFQQPVELEQFIELEQFVELQQLVEAAGSSARRHRRHQQRRHLLEQLQAAGREPATQHVSRRDVGFRRRHRDGRRPAPGAGQADHTVLAETVRRRRDRFQAALQQMEPIRSRGGGHPFRDPAVGAGSAEQYRRTRHCEPGATEGVRPVLHASSDP